MRSEEVQKGTGPVWQSISISVAESRRKFSKASQFESDLRIVVHEMLPLSRNCSIQKHRLMK